MDFGFIIELGIINFVLSGNNTKVSESFPDVSAERVFVLAFGSIACKAKYNLCALAHHEAN